MEDGPVCNGNSRRGWGLLVLAGMFEPLWVVTMKLSEGFTDIPWAIATFVLLFFSMYFLALALKTKVPVGTAYSVWVGIGAVGAVLAGILIFDESSDLIRLVFVAFILIGIVGLQATSGKNEA